LLEIILKLETENVDMMAAFANFLYRARKHLDWDFQEKMDSENCVGVGVQREAEFPENSKKDE